MVDISYIRAKFIFYTVIGIVVMGLILTLPGYAHAQDAFPPSSHDEDILFTFHKLTKTLPSFRSICEESPAYKQAPQIGKDVVLMQEIAKMKTRFVNYDVDSQDLIVKIPVEVYFSDEAPTGMYLGFENPENVFFPYHIGPYDIALVPQGIEQFKFTPLSAQDTKKLASYVTDNTVVLALRLQPVQADAYMPLAIMGNEYWLLMADILTLDVLNTKEQKLWFYHKPGYTIKKEKPSEQDVYWLHQK